MGVIGLRSRSIMAVALVAASLAACGPGSVRTAPPATPVSTVAPPAPTSSVAPTVVPSPSAAAVVCPGDLPAHVSAADLAPPACYGTTELTIDGWLAEAPIFVDHNESAPSWTIPISALYAGAPTVREWTYDFLMAGTTEGLPVVSTPTSGLDLSGVGRWVTVRGRFNDPEVLACTLATEGEYPDMAGPDCDRLFLVTGVEALDRPEPACPTASPISLGAFMAADARCFLGRDVRISGWEDVGEGFGGEAPVYPISAGPDLITPKAQLVSEPWESDLGRDVIFPWVIRGSGVQFDRSDLRVMVTGQIGHPASDGCRPGDFGWTWTPPISWAQHQCGHRFVITDVDPLD